MDAESFKPRSQEIIRFLGYFSLFIVVLAVSIIGKMFFDNRPGLILNSEGIHTKYHGVIPWHLITGFDFFEYELSVGKMEFLIIPVSHPEQLIDRANFSRKLMMRSHLQLYGAPFSLVVSDLKYSAEAILQLITQYTEYYQSQGKPVTNEKQL